MEHKRIKLAHARQFLMKDFIQWIDECSHTRKNCAEDMIEFLFQKDFIRGKKWRKYVDQILEANGTFRWIHWEPLQEGKLPPDTFV